jgi:acetyltransferase
VDLAVIATPAASVPAIIAECVQANVFSAIIISAGFKEAGSAGIELEEQILFHARGHLRIVGPNCLGVMRPSTGLNATFARNMALSGPVAFISQSGAFCTAVLDWSLKEKVGFSAFVSIGSMIDVNWSDLLDYFENDPVTSAVLIYMESIGDAKSFVASAQKCSSAKPIILLKAGRTAESAQAAVSHTGSLAGNDEMFGAAMQRAHVMQIDDISDLFNMADLLAKQPMPKGPHLTMITNAGGPGVVATDALVRADGQLTALGASSIHSFDALLSSHTSTNPIDLLGDAGPEKFAKAIAIANQESASDGILVILAPQDMTDPLKSAECLKKWAHTGKPLLASWMGGNSVAAGKELLHQYQIPVFPYPDMAARSFAQAWRYVDDLQRSKNGEPAPVDMGDFEKVEKFIQDAESQGRTILDEWESKKVLEAYSIPVVRTEIAKSSSEASHLAQKIGFPVVLKLYSREITHKARVGGVQLNLHDAQSVVRAFDSIYSSVKQKSDIRHFLGVTVQPMILLSGYELLLGSTTDEQFGPAILFGFGGNLVEIMRDRSVGFPPLSASLARILMEKTKIYQALKGAKGCPAIDLKQMENVLVQFSQLIARHPRIKESDINPVLASGNLLLSLDARIILHDASHRTEDLPKPVFN